MHPSSLTRVYPSFLPLAKPKVQRIMIYLMDTPGTPSHRMVAFLDSADAVDVRLERKLRYDYA